MANNLIQIKRSTTAAVPASLANGELAFTSNGDVLYIGSPNGSIIGIGGARFPGTLTANQALVANATSGINEIRTALANVGAVYANGSLGTIGQVLTSNGTAVYWGVTASGVAGSNTQIQFNDSGSPAGDADLTFDKITNTLAAANIAVSGTTASTNTTTGAVTVAGGAGVVGRINALDLAAGNTTVFSVVNGTSVSTNNVFATGTVNGSVIQTGSNFVANATTIKLGTTSTDLISINGSVNTNIMPTANATYNLGNTSMRWGTIYSANMQSAAGYFDGSVQISGNLSVLGTTFTVNANTLVVVDPLIQLASNNTVSDLLDIGFFGSYNDGGVPPHEHTGLFRDASDGGVYKLFSGLQDSPTNVVNTTGVGYTTATLQAYLSSGAFISNSTTIAITANASINVAIIANTLTLSTALAGTSGGTGRTTTTNNALLVGNSTNGYTELTLGTSGYVLQSNGTAIVYDTLDGGSF